MDRALAEPLVAERHQAEFRDPLRTKKANTLQHYLYEFARQVSVAEQIRTYIRGFVMSRPKGRACEEDIPI